MKHQIHTDVDIDASPESVWKILSDLDRYEDWNPFIVSAAGVVAVGESLNARIQPPGAKATTFKPSVTEVDPGHTFEWLGQLVLPGVFDGRHRFELEATPNGGTRLVHSESFSGVLVRLLRKSLDSQTVQGFNEMNVALKARVEAKAGSAS